MSSSNTPHIFSSVLKEKLVFFVDFYSMSPQNQISRIFVQEELGSYMQTDRRTHVTNVTRAFLDYTKAPKVI